MMPADLAEFLLKVGCLDVLRRGLRQEIADLLEERRVRVHVDWLALVGAVPAIDLGLQRVAEAEQFAVFRSQLLDDGGNSGPERVGRNPGLGVRLLGDEIEQDRGDLQSVGIDTSHDGLSQNNRPFRGCFQTKSAKNAPKGRVHGPFSPKATVLRRPPY